MKYALTMLMGLFVASCNAAECSEQQSPAASRVPITLINGKRTFTSHVDLSRVEPGDDRGLAGHIAFDQPCVLALLHCRSSTASSGIRRKLHEGRQVHTTAANYNATHKQHPLVRDPHYYLVAREADGAFVGRFIGREKDMQKTYDMKASRLRLLLEEQTIHAQVAAAWIYLEAKACDQATRWYEQVLAPSTEVIPSMRWSLLHELTHVCFNAGKYQEAADYGLKTSEVYAVDPARTLALGMVCRAHVALKQWDRAIEVGEQIYPLLIKNAAYPEVLNDLGCAYEHTEKSDAAWDCYLDAVDEQFPLTINEIREGAAHAAFNVLYYRSIQDAKASGLKWTFESAHKFRVSLQTARILPEKHRFVKTYKAKHPERLAQVSQEVQRHNLDLMSQGYLEVTL